jgi:hypothetical protein
MKWLNLRSYIPPAYALRLGSCSRSWTEVLLTIRVTFRDTRKPVQSNIPDFLLFWT